MNVTRFYNKHAVKKDSLPPLTGRVPTPFGGGGGAHNFPGKRNMADETPQLTFFLSRKVFARIMDQAELHSSYKFSTAILLTKNRPCERPNYCRRHSESGWTYFMGITTPFV